MKVDFPSKTITRAIANSWCTRNVVKLKKNLWLCCYQPLLPDPQAVGHPEASSGQAKTKQQGKTTNMMASRAHKI